MDGHIYEYDTLLAPNSKISFETNCGNNTDYTLPQEYTWVRPLTLQKIDLILGLTFLLRDDVAMLITKDFLQLQRHPISTC